MSEKNHSVSNNVNARKQSPSTKPHFYPVIASIKLYVIAPPFLFRHCDERDKAFGENYAAARKQSPFTKNVTYGRTSLRGARKTIR
jgi:hypothetical protein